MEKEENAEEKHAKIKKENRVENLEKEKQKEEDKYFLNNYS